MREGVVQREERAGDEERVPDRRRSWMRLADRDCRQHEHRRDRGRRARVVETVERRGRRDHAQHADQFGEHREHEQHIDDQRPHESSSRSKKRTNTIPPAKVRSAPTTARIVYADLWKPCASTTSETVQTPPAACNAASASSRAAKQAYASSGSSSAISAAAAQRKTFTGPSAR